MKKSLLLGLAAMTLAMTFIGCQDGLSNPDSITNTENAESLSGPANLQARAYAGVNLITWNVHKDAQTYSVYRTDTVTGITTTLANALSPNDTRYVDAVSTANRLIDGRDYTYTVIANSGTSPVARALDSTSIIHDGASSAGVKAKIPEAGTKVAVPAAADISIESKAIDGIDFFVVKWTDKEAAFNNYTVGYNYGPASGAPNNEYSLTGTAATDSAQNVSDYLTREKYVMLPAIGGGGKLTFRVSGAFVSNGYYTADHVLQEFTAPPLTFLPAVQTFTATREGSSVRLEWSNVKDAKDYDIYKAEVESGVWDGNNNNWVTTIIGPWTAVTTGVKTQGSEATASNWTALESSVDAAKNYRYLIIAKNGDIRSKAPQTAEISGANNNITTPWRDFTATPSANNGVTAVATWNYTDGATYKLERAEAEMVDGDLVAKEPYKPLTLSSASASSYYDSDVQKRHTYIYKLSVTYKGVTKDFVKELTIAPFSNIVQGSLSVQPSILGPKAITVTFSIAGTTYWNDDITAQLFRQETDQNGVAIGAMTTLTDGKGEKQHLIAGGYYEDNDVVQGKYYMYKMTLMSSTPNTTIKQINTWFGSNAGTTPTTYTPVRPSSAGSVFYSRFYLGTSAPTAQASGSSNYFVPKVLDANNYYPLLRGASLYKASGTTSSGTFSGDKTPAASIQFTTQDITTGTYNGLVSANQYYFSGVYVPNSNVSSGYDIYFVLGEDGTPYTITSSGDVPVLMVSRNGGSTPTAQWTTVSPNNIDWQ